MRFVKALLLTVSVSALAVVEARDASACGGCFVQQTENTQVTGHKMILSISTDKTTLWDQISYSGRPSSFGWVLPIHGLAEVGLSSDALFQNLVDQTGVTISSPQITCPPPPDCGFDNAGAGGGSFGASSGTGGGGGPVTIIAQDVVGPYETVQLASADPNALKSWLDDHGYNVPDDVLPIIDSYVAEGFNFLALKLVPGAGVSAMRPVRVTTDGAAPVLPLRMVAAGTGAITPITLWVMGEGRYETTNLPSFVIDPQKLVWNWDTQSSNYSVLKQDAFAATANTGWLIEAGEPFSKYSIGDSLTYLAEYYPQDSGYADENGQGAVEACQADLDALYGTIDDTSLWITRAAAQLSRAALADDLELGASADQSPVTRWFQAEKQIGTPPPCPTFDPCDDLPGTEPSGGGWDFWNNGSGSGTNAGGGSCAMTSRGGPPAVLAGLALMAALAIARRKRNGN